MFIANVERMPDQEAVIDPPNLALIADAEPRRLSWAALFADVERLAALLHGQGLRRDDIVIVQMPNSSSQVALYLACHRLGIVFSPLPVAYRGIRDPSGLADQPGQGPDHLPSNRQAGARADDGGLAGRTPECQPTLCLRPRGAGRCCRP